MGRAKAFLFRHTLATMNAEEANEWMALMALFVGNGPVNSIRFITRPKLWLFAAILAFVCFSRNEVQAIDIDGSDEFETMQAREVLRTDTDLEPLNLGVTVRHHVAMLWGPVPSQDLKLRAEVLLRTMLPFTDVRNDLNITVENPANPSNGPALPPYLPDVNPANPRVPVASRADVRLPFIPYP